MLRSRKYDYESSSDSDDEELAARPAELCPHYEHCGCMWTQSLSRYGFQRMVQGLVRTVVAKRSRYLTRGASTTIRAPSKTTKFDPPWKLHAKFECGECSREKQIGGSRGSLEPPGRLRTHRHTVDVEHLAVTYRLSPSFEPLAENPVGLRSGTQRATARAQAAAAAPEGARHPEP